MSEHDDVFTETPSGPPADWKPDWARWQQMQARGRELARRLGEQGPKLAKLEADLAASQKALADAQAAHATELGTLQARIEDADLRTVDGISDPDPAFFRAQHRAAMAALPEAQRVPLKDWVATQVKTAAERPDEAPRWIRGYLADQGAPPPTTGPKPPPADPKRRPTPPPKGGFTAEQIEAMSPAEYAANEPAILAQLGTRT